MKNNAKKSIKIGRINIPLNYWTGLAVYAVILLILAICMIVYTGSCLKKYENSQSDKVMNDFLNDFTKMAADKTLADNIELPASSEFEGKDTFVNMYMSELDGTTDYTCKKSEGSYNTEEPMYDIYADDKKVARMTLEAKDQHVVLGILTVFDWKIKSIEPVFSAKTNDYTVSIPEGYTFTVNGITVSDDYKTGKVTENPDFVNVSKYVTMPKSVEYKLTGFVNKPEIKVYNASGSEVTANVDAKGNVSLSACGEMSDMPSERKEVDLTFERKGDDGNPIRFSALIREFWVNSENKKEDLYEMKGVGGNGENMPDKKTTHIYDALYSQFSVFEGFSIQWVDGTDDERKQINCVGTRINVSQYEIKNNKPEKCEIKSVTDVATQNKKYKQCPRMWRYSINKD